MSSNTIRLTVGQAVVQFLRAQQVERDSTVQRFFGGALGIFGHGNVAGVGQALLQYRDQFPYYLGRNEQGLVHAATGYAKAKNRLGAMAVTTSIGPGAANMVTGAGTATSNRLPVLLLPSDYFATRRTGSVLQQIEHFHNPDTSTNDAFRAVSNFWDRIYRPEQLPESLLEAMRVLTSPVDVGAATIALPQDVQAEAYDFPVDLFRERIWVVPRQRCDLAQLERAAQLIRSAKRPVIISGGGVIYSEATAKLVGDARVTLQELRERLVGWSVPAEYREHAIAEANQWRVEIDKIIEPGDEQGSLSQSAALGIVNSFAKANDVVINAAGSMPGDLHRIWRPGGPYSYGIEYGYSCMGYEVAAGVGAKLADRDREVITFIGDGTWLMLSSELLTSIQEGLKQIVLIVDNLGYGSIGALSDVVGSQAFGCRFKYRDTDSGQYGDDYLPIDFAANAASYGATVYRANTPAALREAMAKAIAGEETAVIYVEVDAKARFGGSGAWWEVPVAQVAELDSTRQAQVDYDANRAKQRRYL